ncbi:MDIS1-interacting receptor like kinase 2-like protein [Cinnamomum micranthum f. kanehirae]|uniref:non-specific serine/threonine protein kinase n=1 Tax=Cinnamomum micranthum f. kanehirae TaxID=337451 RepID=A0A3S3PU00_9MAGN|nr:MDIS1-interacting receptor like kinase 2-like protein [Cinnamomum micranthum f. kanehirae]
MRSLVKLALYENNLSGVIPPTLGNFTQLTHLYLYENQISGTIPQEIGNMKSLIKLDLSKNNLIGFIPPTLRNLTKLIHLQLFTNQISGTIPLQIGNMRSLISLSLSGNNLTGFIPPTLGNLTLLTALRLDQNQISGTIPVEIGNMRSLVHLSLQQNQISGHVPTSFGEMPFQFSKLKNLEMLNLSHNMLSGSIPSSFEEMLSLSSVDVSYNDLEGPLPNNKAFLQASPEAFIINKDLCGEVQGLRPCNTSVISHGDKKKAHKGAITIVLPLMGVLFLLFALIVIYFVLNRKKRIVENDIQGRNPDLFSVWNYDGRIIYEDILGAIEDFNDKYFIGEGGYGKVYKADLPTGQVVAVKKLHPHEDGEQIDQTSFKNEIQVLTEIRHRNIVKLYGFCSHARCSFLVYEYMERGSLSEVLRNGEAMELDWMKRAKVVQSVAQALSYMHHDCNPPFVHRDLSSNNILLNMEFKACISDFGTARLLKPDSSN